MATLPRHKTLWKLCACAALAAYGPVLAGAHVAFPLPPQGDALVGELSRAPVLPADTLASMAYRYGLGFREVIQANPGINPWLPGSGRTALLPTAVLLPQEPREGIVVNASEMRLYYYPAGTATVQVYPIAVGRADWKTPVGDTWVRAKERNPVWRPTASIRAEHAQLNDPLPEVVPAGPDNPLGDFALRLGFADALIHGTNKPLGGIGMPVTHGCVRLYPDDIQTLFEQVPVGTRVRFIDQRYKLGMHHGQWFLEAHPPLWDEATPSNGASAADVLVQLRAQAGADAKDIDWVLAAAVLHQAVGYPQPVGMQPKVPLRLSSGPQAEASLARHAGHKQRKKDHVPGPMWTDPIDTPPPEPPGLRMEMEIQAPVPAPGTDESQ